MTTATNTVEQLPRARRADSRGDADSIAAGTQIGRYVVLDKIGQGGMGVVYTAYDPELDRKIAVKVLRPHLGQVGQARLLREAQAMAKVAHPNAVAIHDVGLFGERVFLAMELVAGVTLRDWLAVEKRSWRDVVAVMIDAGRGLAAAHEVGLAHRDFKPDNVLIGSDGRPKVTDFGLARRAVDMEADAPARDPVHAVRLSEPRMSGDSDDSITVAGAVIGTPAYMAPEQRDGAPPDLRTDQYSFGVTLYEALYGERPERHDTIVDGSQAPRSIEPPLHKRVPRWLWTVLRRALSHRADDRYPSMQALLADLARGPKRRVRRGILVAGVAALLLGGAAFVHVATRDDAAVCAGAGERLRGAWDADVKTAIQRAFAATNSPFAAESFARTTALLDAYTRNWVAMREDACEATRVRGEQPLEIMSLRMLCLDRAEAQLRALTSVLAAADAGIIDRSAQAALALPRLSECADLQLLARDRSQASTRPGSAFDPKLVHATAKIARVNALYETGRYVDALAAADALAKELGNELPRSVAENAFLQGQTLFARGQSDAAIAAFERASVAAERGAYPLYVARAYGRLAFVWACTKRDATVAERYDAHAQAVMEASGDDALAQTWRLAGLACQRDAANDPAGSTEAMQRAVAIYSKAYGRDGVYATLLTTFGASLAHDPARALLLIDDAIAAHESLLGKAHPRLAFSLTVRGQHLLWLGRYDEASATLRRAIAIRERTVTGPDRLLSSALSVHARVLRELGQLDAAAREIQRAVEIRTALGGKAANDTIDVRVVAASIEIARGRAAAIVAQLEADLPVLVASIVDKANTDTGVIEAYATLGAAYRDVGRGKDAIATTEKALAGATSRKDPRLTAEAQFLLAEVLATDARQAPRARELAIEAKRLYASLPNPAKASAIERWLAGR